MYPIKAALVILLIVGIFGCGESRQGTDLEGAPPGEAESYARINELKENIADDPNNLDWRYQLAREYERIGKNMEALKAYEEALAIDPGQTDLKFNYAELALKMGDRRKAFQSYKEILLGSDGEQYLGRIAPKFLDAYKVLPRIATDAPEAFGTYSSDGTKIIYQAFVDNNWDIYQYDLISQSSTPLITDPAHDENPAFSTDQRYLVYTSTRDDHRDVEYIQKLRDIYVKDLFSNRNVNLTTNSSNDWRPRFSRDGKYIVFVSERSDLRDVGILDLYSQIFIMESDGSFQLEITKVEANNGGPVMVGGENDPIYFDSNRNGTYDIFKMNADGSNLSQITYNSEINDVAPDISSDGIHIAFFSDRDGNYEIYMMNNDGSNQQKMTANPSDDLNPIFSPDGKKILFHSDRFGNYDIFELDLEQKSEKATLTEVVAFIDAALSSM